MVFWNFVKTATPRVLLALALLILIYFILIRPWILHMGASKEEVNMTMDGDGLVKNPVTKYTHAITIDAPKDIVWGYLAQVGWKRAGWYNWDFVNRLADKEYFYESNMSADRIIPELQNLKQGDKIYILPQMSFDVEMLKENETMLLVAKENDKYMVTWSYMLKEIDQDTSRLYVRWNSRLGDGVMVKVMDVLLTEPGGVGIQQTQMLHGIRERAERDFKQLNIQGKD